jgi:hypothetical protein
MVTSLTNVTHSQYDTVVAVGRGVFVGTGVLVEGSGVAVAGMVVCVGAFWVTAYIVCVTIACTVAAGSLGAVCVGLTNGRASMVTGKHAMIAKAKMPNKIRVEFVVSFIVHLQFVQEMDARPVKKFLICSQ